MHLTLGCCCSLVAVAVVFRDLLHTTGLAANRKGRWATGRTEQDEMHVMLAIVGAADEQAVELQQAIKRKNLEPIWSLIYHSSCQHTPNWCLLTTIKHANHPTGSQKP